VKEPAFELEPEEAKALAEGMTNVANHYSMTVDPKTVAWIALFGTLFAIYGPRIGALVVHNASKTVQKKAVVMPEGANMPTPIRPVEVAPFMPPQQFGN
jgi:hypothetical protein